MTEPTSPPAPAPVRRLFTATLVMGIPGSGKTSLFKTFAEYLWETFGKILLLYSWDGGAIPTDVQQRMRQGLIRFWRARTRSGEGLALETLYLASRGHWPRRINADTGETSPAVELVPPVTTKYEVRCPQQHLLATVPSRSLVVPMFCPPCNQFVGQPDLQVLEIATRTKGFEMVGGVGFDGLTSMADSVMDHMDLQRGAGQIGGEKAAFGGVVSSGGLKFGGNNRADVGFSQTRAQRFVMNSLSIPYLVEGPVFTALTMEASDEGGLAIVGAKLPGRAATDEASAWFGNVFETGQETDDTNRKHFAIYLRPFTDAQNRRHLLKTSASSMGLPDKLLDPPIESHQPFTQVNLGYVFKQLDEDLRRKLREELPNAPGIPSEYMEYGETFTIQQPAAVPMAAAGAGAGIPVMGPRATLPTVQTAPAPIPAPPPQTPAESTTPIPAPTAPAPPASSPAAAAPPVAPAPRTRRRANGGAGVPVTTVATPPPTPPAPPPPVQPVTPPQSVQTAAPAPTAGPPVMGAPRGTAAPPPPGMRPPARLPGT